MNERGRRLMAAALIFLGASAATATATLSLEEDLTPTASRPWAEGVGVQYDSALDPEGPFMQIALRPATSILDAGGNLIAPTSWAHRTVDNSGTWSAVWITSIVDDNVVRMSLEGPGDAPREYKNLEPAPHRAWQASQATYRFPDAPVAPPCIAAWANQATLHAPTTTCAVATPIGSITVDATAQWELVGHGAEGLRVFSTRADEYVVQTWWTPAAPYPLRMDVYAGEQRVASLRATDAATPLAQWPETLPPMDRATQPAPPFEEGPARPWGPDRGHWYRAEPEVAWNHMMADERVRQFMDAHPNAAIRRAEWRDEYRAADEPGNQTWTFHIQDPESGLIGRVTFPPYAARFMPVDGPDPTANLNLELSVESAPGGPTFAASRLPTLTGLIDRAAAYLGPVGPVGFEYDLSADATVRIVAAGASGMQENELRATDGEILFRINGDAVAAWSAAASNDLVAPSAGPGQQAAVPTPQSPREFSPLEVAAAASLTGAILAGLYYLWPQAKLALVGLFSRIDQDAALEHPLRAQMVQLIDEQPGIHRQQLVRSLGVGNGQADHHLRILQNTGHVRAHRDKGFTCYVGRNTPWRQAIAAPALRSETAKQIFDAIQAAPGITSATVATRLGVSRSTVSHHVNRMESAAVIRRQRSVDGVRLFAIEGAGAS